MARWNREIKKWTNTLNSYVKTQCFVCHVFFWFRCWFMQHYKTPYIRIDSTRVETAEVVAANCRFVWFYSENAKCVEIKMKGREGRDSVLSLEIISLMPLGIERIYFASFYGIFLSQFFFTLHCWQPEQLL